MRLEAFDFSWFCVDEKIFRRRGFRFCRRRPMPKTRRTPKTTTDEKPSNHDKGKPVTTIPSLGLTPAQMVEVMASDPDLVAAWLDEVDRNPRLNHPAGFFVKGLRSGQPPATHTDVEKTKAVERAERFMRIAGFQLPCESEVQAELFGEGGPAKGILRPWASDHELIEHMNQLWRDLQ